MTRAIPLRFDGASTPSTREFEEVLHVIERSGVVEILTPLFLRSTGRRRSLHLLPLLYSFAAVGVRPGHRMLVIDAARQLNALTPKQRGRLGIECRWDPDQTYDRLDRSFNRLAALLEERHATTGDAGHSEVMDALWLANRLVAASIAPDLPRSRAVAVDGTHLETWGALSFRSELLELDGEAKDEFDGEAEDEEEAR